MSLDKAILYRKEKRQVYRGSKRFDCQCRNHGTCSYCLNNRMYKHNKKIAIMNAILKEAV